MHRLKYARMIAAILLTRCHLSVNTKTRKWQRQDRSKFTAELVSYHPKTDSVRIKFNDRLPCTSCQFDSFSTFDRTWRAGWSEFAANLEQLLLEMAGEVLHLQTNGEYPAGICVYYPTSYKQANYNLRAAILLFNDKGEAARYLMRHIEAGLAGSQALQARDCTEAVFTVEDSHPVAAPNTQL
jgi:hypothetical protein